MALVVAVHVGVGQGQQGVAAALGEFLEPILEVGPQRRAVERHDRSGHRVAVAQPARIVGLGRLAHQRVHHVLEDGDGLGRVGAQRAAGVFGAVGSEVVERLLEGGRLVDVGLDRVSVRVDRTVEDHRPHLVREGLRVGRADPRAVRVAQVGQLRIAQGGPQHVEVLDHVGGAHVGQELLAHLVDAALHELLLAGLDVLDAGGAVVDLRVGPVGVVVSVGVAPQRRRRRADPARVEPDHVETLPHLLRERLEQAHGRVDTGLPRPARVDHQRADLLPGGRDADQRQVRLRTVGFGVVDRNGELAALRALGQAHGGTAADDLARAPLGRRGLAGGGGLAGHALGHGFAVDHRGAPGGRQDQGGGQRPGARGAAEVGARKSTHGRHAAIRT